MLQNGSRLTLTGIGDALESGRMDEVRHVTEFMDESIGEPGHILGPDDVDEILGIGDDGFHPVLVRGCHHGDHVNTLLIADGFEFTPLLEREVGDDDVTDTGVHTTGYERFRSVDEYRIEVGHDGDGYVACGPQLHETVEDQIRGHTRGKCRCMHPFDLGASCDGIGERNLDDDHIHTRIRHGMDQTVGGIDIGIPRDDV